MIYEFIAQSNSALVGFVVRQVAIQLNERYHCNEKLSNGYSNKIHLIRNFDVFYQDIGIIYGFVELLCKPYNCIS
jgi:hypothetical protein